MKNKHAQSYKYILIFNLILVSVLCADFFIPSQNYKKEQFLSFYNTVKHYNKLHDSNKDTRYVLECESGQIFYLTEFPPNHKAIMKGTDILVNRSMLFQKAKKITISNQSLSLYLNHPAFLICIAISLIANFLCFFYRHKISDLVMVLSTIPNVILLFFYFLFS